MKNTEDINFSKLEKEFRTAKQADEKYARENDAKFRAVHQKVGSYEEFRDIVAASHLQPLDRNDITGVTDVKQPWNRYADSTKATTPNVSKIVEQPVHDATGGINTRNKFLKVWKTLCTSHDRIEFLFQFDKDFLVHVLECDIPMDFMETTICAILEGYATEYAQRSTDVLHAFTKSKRFSLSLKFLGKTDKQRLVDLFERLKVDGDNEMVEGLVKCFDVS